MIDPRIPAEYINQIMTGDARELARRIPDESVDLIFTDPVYDRIDDYRWLAETAARVLKPNSAALVFYGIGYLPQIIKALTDGGLSYRWQFTIARIDGPTSHSKRFFHKGFNKFSGCLWFEKGVSCPEQHISDTIFSKNGKWDSDHEWMKSPETYMHWLSRFVEWESIVFDPFTGGGTVPAVCKMLGRNYIAFEIDPSTAERARERVRNTQPPLFVLQPEQTEMEL